MRLDWIAIDWGSTRLRVWALSGDRVLAEAHSDDGMARLAASAFEPALMALIGDWLAGDRVTPAFACGMVGSRQGWHEAPYRTVPCPPLGASLAAVPTRDPRLRLWIAPGLCQPAPADVMRGEETQIAGFLALNPGWDGVICLPGTHSKWVHVSAGEVVSFQTFMTGEIFALLSSASVLRHCVEGWDGPAFLAGFDAGFDRPDRLLARLFSIRADAILHDLAPAEARARLSGYLIGAELAAAKAFWLGQRVALIGAPSLIEPYQNALAHLSIPTTIAAADQMTLAGLAVARALAPQESR